MLGSWAGKAASRQSVQSVARVSKVSFQVRSKRRGLLEKVEPARVSSGGAWDSAQPRPGGCRLLARNPIKPCCPGVGSFVSGTPGSSGSIFSGGPGEAFPVEANSKPRLSLCPGGAGARCPRAS